MTYQGVFTKKEYDEDGETKVKWYRVGHIKTTDQGGRFMHLPLFPATDFFIFDDDEEVK